MTERDPSGKERFQGVEIKRVECFRYSGSTVRSSEEDGKQVKKHMQDRLELLEKEGCKL